MAMPQSDQQNDEAPSQLGQFRFLSRLGAGGSGTVYLAERIDGLPQPVAVKVLHSFGTDPGREERMLSSLDHVNIVRLLGQGMSQTGQRYLVLEYVDGLPIDEFCDHHCLTVAARLQLMQKVMEGVAYAHRHTVVHADLKPSNILIDQSCEPKILDFGIAKILGESEGADISFLTPAFASPEQRKNEKVGVASDVYALGLLTTFLLTGSSPVTGADSAILSVPLLKQASAESIRTLAERRSTTPAGLRRAFSPDLEAILHKSLQIDPVDRYASVEAFSNDIQAYLEGRPTAARPVGTMERTRKWVGRHLVLAGTVAGFAGALLISTVGIALQTARAETQRRTAQDRLQELVRLTAALDGDLYTSVESLPESKKAKDILLRSATQTLDQLSIEASDDPVLVVELAQEYEKLARLQILSGGAGSTDQRREAASDINKAISLLRQHSQAGAKAGKVSAQLAELQALHNNLAR